MNLNPLVAAMLAAGVGTGAVVLSEADLSAAYADSMRALSGVQETNDEQLLKAAVVMWQVERGTSAVPTVEELVKAGYLDEKFVGHEKLQAP